MKAVDRPPTLAEMPVQRPASPATPVEARARFFNSGNAFNRIAPPVPAAIFTHEAAAARRSETTQLFACDQSAALDVPSPATTPLMLARYATVAAGDPLVLAPNATGTIWYAIAGSGEMRVGDETSPFGAGDVLVTPGGVPVSVDNAAAGAPSVLWLVSNEPLVTFQHAEPHTGDGAAVAFVRYPAAEVARQLERVVAVSGDDATAGIALIFSTERDEDERTIVPELTLSLNTVPAGAHQRLHRHQSAAVTLVVQGERCWSLVGDERCAWAPFATLVTPPGAPHAHYNDGDERAVFLIVQDGGFHQHARTMGFAFLEGPATA